MLLQKFSREFEDCLKAVLKSDRIPLKINQNMFKELMEELGVYKSANKLQQMS